jgi:hypothetical protein
VVVDLSDVPVQAIVVARGIRGVLNSNVLKLDLKLFDVLYPCLEIGGLLVEWEAIAARAFIQDQGEVVLFIHLLVGIKIQHKHRRVIGLSVVFEFLVWLAEHVIVIVKRRVRKSIQVLNGEEPLGSVEVVHDWHVFAILIEKEFLVPNILLSSQL